MHQSSTEFDEAVGSYVQERLGHPSKNKRGKVRIWFKVGRDAIKIASIRFDIEDEDHLNTYLPVALGDPAHFSVHGRTNKAHIKESSVPGSEALTHFETSKPIENIELLIERVWPDTKDKIWLLVPPGAHEVATVEERGIVVHSEHIFEAGLQARLMPRKRLLRRLSDNGCAGLMLWNETQRQVIITVAAQVGISGLVLGGDQDRWQKTAIYNEIIGPTFGAVAELCKRRHQTLTGLRTKKIPEDVMQRITNEYKGIIADYRSKHPDLIERLGLNEK